MPQNRAIEKRSLFDTALASGKVHTYVPPSSDPATVESLSDLIDEMIVVSRFIREASSQWGKSTLVEVIRQNAQAPDTVFVNQTTVLYKQMKDGLEHGPFVAQLVQYESQQNKGNFYYSLEAPDVDEAGSARSARAVPNASGNDTDDLPF